MTRRASGFWEASEGRVPAPRLRVGLGFGPGRLAAFEALVDSGSDVCVFPTVVTPEPGSQPVAFLELAGLTGDPVNVPTYRGTITAGDIREIDIDVVLLQGAEPLLGRSFLNRCRVTLDAPARVVTVEK